MPEKPIIMDVRIKKETDVIKLFEIKDIEDIKTSSKTITFLLNLYDENIKLKRELEKYKPI
jgi:hypothetical protein